MKVIVVGLGVQGNKRIKIAGKDLYCTVDPYSKKANYKDISQVPLNKYQAVMLCVPENKKFKIINYCIENKKHNLIEKPLIFSDSTTLKKLENKARKNNTYCYVAYNHRFEPHFVNIKKYINFNKLGKIYSCRIFYGNGTAKLVKKSLWRDTGNGVISDIGSHLIDILLFWFELKKIRFNVIKSLKNENLSPDHAIIISKLSNPSLILEMSLCMWKNDLKVDIIGSRGSVHIDNLCKWGKSVLTYRKRILPSGPPLEKKIILPKGDKTWEKEYKYFKSMIGKGAKTSFKKDLIIQNALSFK